MKNVLLALFLLAVPSLLAGATAPPAPNTLNVGYSAQSVSSAPLWVTQESGAFSKYGLDVRPIFLAGPLAPAAVLSGEVKFAIMSAGVAIPPVLGGADLVMIANLTNYISHALVVASDIAEPRQLKDKRIGVQRFEDVTHMAAREAVKYLGLSDSDVFYMQIGGVPTRFAALQNLAVQAAILNPPYVGRAQKLGYRVLISLYDLKIPFSTASVVTTRQLIASNRAIVLDFLKALVEGIHFYKRQRVASLRIIDRHLRGLPPEELADAMDHYIRDLDNRLYPRPEGLKLALELIAKTNPAAKGADPGRFLDGSLLQQLEREGFFARLQSGGK